MNSTPNEQPSTASLIYVRHADCEPWSENPRKHAESVDDEMRELISSISTNGVRQSLTVRLHPTKEGAFQIAAGARRWHALGHAIEAGARPADDPLPIRVEPLDDFAMKAAALEENLQRKPMTALEEAEAYFDLSKTAAYGDQATAAIASKVGKSQRHVQSYIAMARDLSKAAKVALADGRINVSHARVLTGVAKRNQDRFVATEVGAKPLRMERKVMRALLGGGKSESKKAAATSRKRTPLLARAADLRTAIVRAAIERRPEIALRLAALYMGDQARRNAAAINDLPSDLEAVVTSTQTEERWAFVADLRISQLHALLARLLAIALAPRLASLDTPSDLLGVVGHALELEEAAATKIDDVFLSLYPKRLLLEMAIESKAVSKEGLADIRRLPPAKIRSTILESSTRDRSWVPAELRFGSSSESISKTDE